MSYKIKPLDQVEFTYAISHGLDAIFFEASATRAFPSEEARSGFRLRWLANYLLSDSDCCFIALSPSRRVIGYVVGSLSDPAGDPRYADLTYFEPLARHTARYPAHLHINVALQHRNHGVGERLIEAFASRAAAAQVPGVHVVTGEGMRNIGFYVRNGFTNQATAPWKSGNVVLLGRPFGGA